MTKAAITSRARNSKLTTTEVSSRPAASKLSELRVGRELADTTWRMTIPVVLFAGLGIVADKSIGSQPWITIAGTAVGFVCAGWLIKLQLQRWPNSPVRPGSYERNRRPGDNDDQEKDYYND